MYINGCRSSQQQSAMSDDTLLPAMSDDIFLPLSKPLLTHDKILRNSEPPSDLLAIMNTELRSTLTLRSLVNLCVACKVKKPTAQMLAFALQNSIPCLTGLPMDNPDPGFYIDVATKFYDKTFATMEHKVHLYRCVHHYRQRNEFFPAGTDLDGVLNEFYQFWPRAMDFYIRNELGNMGGRLLGTHEGRKMAKELMLEWKKHYEGHGPEIHKFIDYLVEILDHGFVFKVEYGIITTGVSFYE